MTEIYLKVVKRALAIISSEDKWCKDAPARTKDGESRSDHNWKDNYSYSLVSALEYACEDVGEAEPNFKGFYFEQFHTFMTWLYWKIDWHRLNDQLEKEMNVRDLEDENHSENLMRHIKATSVEFYTDMATLCHDFFEEFNDNPGIEYRHIRGILEQVIETTQEKAQ